MSFLKTINIQHLTSGTNNIVLDANGNMTCAGTISAATPTGGMRNKIINGDMRIDQRNAGAAVTQIAGSAYPVDRWNTFGSVTSKFTAQRNAGSVTPPAGFSNYVGVTSSSTYSFAAQTEEYDLYQYIEGFNIADLAWGTSSAKPITLSFWVRSSLTGTFGGSIANYNSTRTYTFQYRINTANTWEFETITIPGDTTGTWYTDNLAGLLISFSMGAGSTKSAPVANTWNAANYTQPSGTISLVGTNGATFYITGVQVETGSVATAFERRLHGTELALCQRYYETGETTFSYSGFSSQNMYFGVPFKVIKRATPTVTRTGNGIITASTAGSSITSGGVTDSIFYFEKLPGSTAIGGYWTAAIEL